MINRLRTYVMADPWFVSLALLSSAPLWVTKYPPMVDLPQHVAQISMLSDWFTGGFHYQPLFEVEIFTPYLLGYGLAGLLSFLVSELIAAKIVLSAALVGFCLVIPRLLATVGGNQSWRWLGITVVIGYSYYWGFMNFIVAAPLALCYFLYGVKYADGPTRKRGLILALLGPILFFCHVFSAIFFIGSVGLYIILRNRKIVENLRIAWPLYSIIPVIIVWLMLTVFNGVPLGSGVIEWYYFLARYTALLSMQLGAVGLVLVFVGPVIVLLPFALGGRLSPAWSRRAPLLFLVAVLLFAPQEAAGVGHIYPRFTLFLVPMLLFALDDTAQALGTVIMPVLAPVLAAGIVLMHISIAVQFGRDQNGFEGAIQVIPEQQRVLALPFGQYSGTAYRSVYDHFPTWYQSERNGLVDFNFAYFFHMPVRYKAEILPAVRRDFVPAEFDWEKQEGACYDYFISQSGSDPFSTSLARYSSSVQLVFNKNMWWVHKNLNRSECAIDRVLAANAKKN